MTIKAMNWAWDTDLPPATKLVLLKLADRANDDGECWPGQASIAKACCIGTRTLIRHLAALEKMGLIRSDKRYGEDGKRSTNVYILNIDGALSANLAHGLSAKSCKNHVPTVTLTLKEEPTVLNHMAHTMDAEQKPLLDSPVVFIGDGWKVDDAVFDAWIRAFQNGRTFEQTEDWIEQELAKAALWLKANPSRRKKNHLKYLTGWLARSASPTNGFQSKRISQH